MFNEPMGQEPNEQCGNGPMSRMTNEPNGRVAEKPKSRMAYAPGTEQPILPDPLSPWGIILWGRLKIAAPGASWEAIGYSTRVRHAVTGLESYKAYWFCVSAIAAAGEGAQSDPALGRAA